MKRVFWFWVTYLRFSLSSWWASWEASYLCTPCVLLTHSYRLSLLFESPCSLLLGVSWVSSFFANGLGWRLQTLALCAPLISPIFDFVQDQVSPGASSGILQLGLAIFVPFHSYISYPTSESTSCGRKKLVWATNLRFPHFSCAVVWHPGFHVQRCYSCPWFCPSLGCLQSQRVRPD